MWIYNTDTSKWELQINGVDIIEFDNLKQDMSKTALYSKALSGASYLYTNYTDNIYESLNYRDYNSWFVDPSSSVYNSVSSLPGGGKAINQNSFSLYQKYTHEYGFTLKNTFTPIKGIKNSNFISVSAATTNAIDLNSTTISTIDGIKLKNGDRILVKDQISTVSLQLGVDPDDYFIGNYYLISENTSDNTYNFYNSDNGIYVFNQNSLTKSIIATYSNSSNLNVYVNIGNINADKQFRLSRKLDGYYPIETEPFEFKETKSYLVRNQVDYNNLYENNYYDILKHGTQSLQIEGYTYSIPQRTLYIGDFGSILNVQDIENSQYVYNVYKKTLKSITETSKFYWICGNEGTLLRMNKITFDISKVDLKDEFNNLNSIHFLNDNNGIVVGDYNTIYYTKNGGYKWNKLEFSNIENYIYTKVIYYSFNNVFISGKNGVFLKLTYSDTSGWNYEKINIEKTLTTSDKYELIEDINDMYYSKFSNWNLTYSSNSIYSINPEKECIFLVANSNNIIIYEVNNFVPEHKFMYLSFSYSFGDINTIARQKYTNNMVFSGDDIIKFDISYFNNIATYSNVVTSYTFSTLNETYSNKLYDYEGRELLGVGNYALSFNMGYTGSYATISSVDIIPKMLFMDYDMANKLNFFDSDYNYRLPDGITFSIGTLSSVNFSIENTTWLDYMTDTYKTYGVNSDTSSGDYVVMSTTFSSGTASLTFSTSDITLQLNDIGGLYPNLYSPTASRYKVFSPTVSNAYSVYMHKYMTIFKFPNDFCEVGDMIQISSENVIATLIINYKFGSYYYAFNDFNQAILNSIKSYNLIVRNLNKFSDVDELLYNFNYHPISDGYSLTQSNGIITVQPKFNRMTAYKSLQSKISINSSDSYTMSYPVSYNQFGYTPNYNLMNYLSSVNSSFTASKKFYAMPEYSNLPGNAGGSFTDSNIYYDSNQNSTYLKNKLVFGNDLKFEYDTLWVNTFVDVVLDTSSGILTKEQVLITDKYYDGTYSAWALVFNDSLIHVNGFNYYGVSINSINIISRNTLSQISSDLEIFNNLNKPLTTKYYNNNSWVYRFYENPIRTKINTDSYAKILLSDGDIKKYITSVIFTDSKNNLLINVLNTNRSYEVNIKNSYKAGNNVAINTDNLFGLEGTQLAYIDFTGGTSSSEELNPDYIGVRTVNKLDDNNILIDYPYGNLTYANDVGKIKYNSFDPFFNYDTISLLEIGDDSMYKIPTEILNKNIQESGNTYSIVNFQNNNSTFRLVDGLDINKVSREYHWILEAEISDAIIGENSDGIVWYSGTWHTGRWFGGTWYSGSWISGDWYSGNWYSYEINDKVTFVEVGQKNISNLNSIWYNGRWFDGYWDAGIWQNGRRYSGIWNDGIWYNGIWNDGTWNKGLFAGGIWVRGIWKEGIFNSSNKPSYWIDGSFNSGDFQNGIWYDGSFGLSYSVVSKFGSSASNSRNAIWQGGVWASGNFYSNENNTDVSTIHKYSTWKTGIFNQGNFYGGIVYNIEFNNGTWHGGIVKDIQIIGVNPLNNEIILNGIFRFNINDNVNIINNGTETPYYNLGNDSNPGRYRVALVRYDLTNNWTTLTLDYDFSSLSFDSPYETIDTSNIDTGVKLVSRFKEVDWNSGVWENGIFDGGIFYGGIWYNGVFNGSWGI